MRRYFSVFVVLVTSLALLGCNRAEPKKPKAQGQAASAVKLVPVQAPPQGKEPPKGRLARLFEIPDCMTYLRNIGIGYNQVVSETGKGPKTKEDLNKAAGNARQIKEWLDSGQVVVIYGVSANQISGTKILAYEPEADVHGIRLVLLGDGSVQKMDDAEFQKTPKAK